MRSFEKCWVKNLEEILISFEKLFENEKKNACECQELGLYLLKFENGNIFQEKLLKIVERKLYVFGGRN